MTHTCKLTLPDVLLYIQERREKNTGGMIALTFGQVDTLLSYLPQEEKEIELSPQPTV